MRLQIRKGRSNILKEYIETTNAGEPWVIPADTIEVTSIKPLSLNDLALSDGVTLDKKTVAAILDVPAFGGGRRLQRIRMEQFYQYQDPSSL